MIGPFRGGRVASVTGASDGVTFYFGAVDGGVWKTSDAGLTWNPVFDGQPIASIGAVEVAPSNPNVLYAGTGESDIRSALSSGDGVYKSSDAGKTWKNIGLHDSRQISRIVIDPHNPDVVYVGALGHAYGPNDERGVFKSTDGGATWTHVLDKGPDGRRLRSGDCGSESECSVRGNVECASSSVEHLRSAARARRRTLSLDRQRRDVDSTQRQWSCLKVSGDGWV